jgi:hypothetical protein
MKIARYASQGKTDKIIAELQKLDLNDKRGTWGYFANKFVSWLEDMDSKAPFTIMIKGNSKLPFYAFSNLPIVNCPGAGECASISVFPSSAKHSSR